MKSIYNVPVIPQNLPNSETIVQIAEALNYLSDVANDIFDRVNNRINTNNSKVNLINERIQLVSNKINNLEECGAKKATRVFSSSKYPAGDLNKKYVTIFESDEALPVKQFTNKYKPSTTQTNTMDTLQIYHVKKNDKPRKKLEGLGKLPKNIVSINDMLLFNSGINLYNNYIFSDTLKVDTNKKTTAKQDISEIGDAPISISDKSIITKSAGDTYSYAPDLGDVPTIDLPLDLPNLPGIADDLRYINDSGPTIAPSLSFSSNSHEETLSDDAKVVDISDLDLPPPPPQPTIPAEIVEEKEIIVEEKIEIIKHEEVQNVKDEPLLPKTQMPVDNNNAHANLMEAIRKAGGSKNAKLKPADSKKPTTQVTTFVFHDIKLLSL